MNTDKQEITEEEKRIGWVTQIYKERESDVHNLFCEHYNTVEEEEVVITIGNIKVIVKMGKDTRISLVKDTVSSSGEEVYTFISAKRV